MTFANRDLITSTNIREYFQESVVSALDNQHIEAETGTICYIVNLLTEFSRTECFIDHAEGRIGLKPLAFLYGEAVEASGSEQRNRAYRRLGDIALFIAGVFADSLNRKLVDVDYYVAMGGNAYSHLSDGLRGSMSARMHGAVYEELAVKFVDFVDVLGEVSEQTHLESDTDVLRLYEVWVRTGSTRAARKLSEIGIQPAENNVSHTQH